MDVEALLAPVSDDEPAGADLYGDPERTEIELAFEPDAEVDWRHIVQLIEAQAGRTKDVWLGVYLARAGARMGRLDVVTGGCEFLAGLFEHYWEMMHPTLDELGFQGRKGPCESLTRIGEFLGPLRRVVLFSHPRLGSYTGDDLRRFADEGAAADGYGMFRAAVEETEPATFEEVLDQLDRMEGALRLVDAVLVAEADGDTGTDFTPTYEVVGGIRKALRPFVTGAQDPSTSDEPDDAADDAPVASRGGEGRIGGRVESRADVGRAFDAVIDYYRRAEPSSPVPVALARLRAWVDMDFMEILKDIAPNSVDDAASVLLRRPSEDEE